MVTRRLWFESKPVSFLREDLVRVFGLKSRQGDFRDMLLIVTVLGTAKPLDLGTRKPLFLTILGTAKPPVLGTRKPLVLGTRKPLKVSLEIRLDEIEREQDLFGPGSTYN